VDEKYNYYLNNQKEFEKIIITGRFLKKHILKEQNNCCDICKNKNEWNGKPIVFVLDHINGDASNNRRENIRLVCPNCDSQLDTFKSKNKNSSRKERYFLNYKNKK
jgi:RNA polymerase subunit RPABC4/transcription elongation factor Spt4